MLDIELRFLAGAVASAGYFEDFFDNHKFDFIFPCTFGKFKKNHFSILPLSTVAEILSPSGRLISEFYLDPNFEKVNRKWDETDNDANNFNSNSII